MEGAFLRCQDARGTKRAFPDELDSSFSAGGKRWCSAPVSHRESPRFGSQLSHYQQALLLAQHPPIQPPAIAHGLSSSHSAETATVNHLDWRGQSAPRSSPPTTSELPAAASAAWAAHSPAPNQRDQLAWAFQPAARLKEHCSKPNEVFSGTSWHPGPLINNHGKTPRGFKTQKQAGPRSHCSMPPLGEAPNTIRRTVHRTVPSPMRKTSHALRAADAALLEESLRQAVLIQRLESLVADMAGELLRRRSQLTLAIQLALHLSRKLDQHAAMAGPTSSSAQAESHGSACAAQSSVKAGACDDVGNDVSYASDGWFSDGSDEDRASLEDGVEDVDTDQEATSSLSNLEGEEHALCHGQSNEPSSC